VEIAGYDDIVEIGRGRASTVYRARQQSTGRPVAVKVLTVTRVEQPLQRRFERESTVTERLAGNPHIVEVLDRGFTGAGYPYVTTPFYIRGSFEDHLTLHGPLPVHDALRVGVQLAGALDAVHAAGVLHRDIKPSNVLEADDGSPALTGFGISAVDPTNRPMTMAQSFAATHTPPEVILGQAATRATDTYLLGSTLYTLLAGHAPFDIGRDDGIVALLGRIQSAEVPPFDRPDVPDSLLDALRAAMAKDPAERPSAEAFARALQACQRELGVAPTPLPGDAGEPGHTGGAEEPDEPEAPAAVENEAASEPEPEPAPPLTESAAPPAGLLLDDPYGSAPVGPPAPPAVPAHAARPAPPASPPPVPSAPPAAAAPPAPPVPAPPAPAAPAPPSPSPAPPPHAPAPPAQPPAAGPPPIPVTPPPAPPGSEPPPTQTTPPGPKRHPTIALPQPPPNPPPNPPSGVYPPAPQAPAAEPPSPPGPPGSYPTVAYPPAPEPPGYPPPQPPTPNSGSYPTVAYPPASGAASAYPYPPPGSYPPPSTAAPTGGGGGKGLAIALVVVLVLVLLGLALVSLYLI
jgi:serine/threonine protein kinase